MVETKRDIGYVCLSDTHFGGEDSLLTSVKRGWVIDTIHRRPPHGAAVVLMDKEFNLCSLRMFNEGHYIPKVEACGCPGLNRNPFYRRISELVNPYLNPWKDFSQIVADEVEIRAQNPLDRLVYWN